MQTVGSDGCVGIGDWLDIYSSHFKLDATGGNLSDIVAHPEPRDDCMCVICAVVVIFLIGAASKHMVILCEDLSCVTPWSVVRMCAYENLCNAVELSTWKPVIRHAQVGKWRGLGSADGRRYSLKCSVVDHLERTVHQLDMKSFAVSKFNVVAIPSLV